MDIVITIPKTENWDTWLKECENVADDPNSRLNYRIGDRALPTKTSPGDRCYVLHDGYVRGYHIIAELKHRGNGFICDTTGNYWASGNYIIRKGKFHPIKPIKMRGFPGWKYFDKEVEVII